MDPNQPNTTPVVPTPTSKPSMGAFIGIIVILLVIIFGAFYFWGKMLDEKAATNSLIDASVEMLNKQNSSDEISSIEADLNATVIESLDKELGDIDTSLKDAGL
jgi:Flp pilus assembly protein TadG